MVIEKISFAQNFHADHHRDFQKVTLAKQINCTYICDEW